MGKRRDLLKLSKLLLYWAEHNKTHKENFLKWCDTVQDYGLVKIAENLNKAIEMLDKSSEYLIEAAKESMRNINADQ